jgi:glutathione S-transferase
MTVRPLVLAGWYGSPYSWKMRGVLRYRGIPFRWVVRDSKWDDIPDPPVRIVPVIVFPQPDGSYGEVMVDSSPQIMRLEAEFSGRSIVPTDPAVAFIDALIEDYADEWLTKAMYHYRWAFDNDIQTAGHVLPAAGNRRLSSDQHEAAATMVIERQTGRRALVGSTEETAPIIESSYERVLDVFSELFSQQEFFLGDRPGRGDFGLYGQLTQLVQRDPTPTAIAARRAPKIVSWIDDLDDLSWLPDDGDVGWSSLDSLPSATTDSTPS